MITTLPSLWHFFLAHWAAVGGVVTGIAWPHTPPGKRYARWRKERSRVRQLRKPGKPDENGWRPRATYERRR